MERQGAHLPVNSSAGSIPFHIFSHSFLGTINFHFLSFSLFHTLSFTEILEMRNRSSEFVSVNVEGHRRMEKERGEPLNRLNVITESR